MITLEQFQKAIDLAEEGISYTFSYFREKWRMDENLAELKAIAEVETAILNALAEHNAEEGIK